MPRIRSTSGKECGNEPRQIACARAHDLRDPVRACGLFGGQDLGKTRSRAIGASRSKGCDNVNMKHIAYFVLAVIVMVVVLNWCVDQADKDPSFQGSRAYQQRMYDYNGVHK